MCASVYAQEVLCKSYRNTELSCWALHSSQVPSENKLAPTWKPLILSHLLLAMEFLSNLSQEFFFPSFLSWNP